MATERPTKTCTLRWATYERDSSRRINVSTGTIQAHVWQGETSRGAPVYAFITRIAVDDYRPAEDYLEFEQDLIEHTAPHPDVAGIPIHLTL